MLKLNFSKLNLTLKDIAKSAKNILHATTYDTDMRAFNILFPEFLQFQVSHIRNTFKIFKYFFNASQNPFQLSQIASLNVVQHSGKLTVVNVPGDENCWVYGALISRYYCAGEEILVHLQDCRNKITDLLMRVSEFPSGEQTLLLREMGLHTSSKGFKLNLLSNALHFKNMLEMLSALI